MRNRLCTTLLTLMLGTPALASAAEPDAEPAPAAPTPAAPVTPAAPAAPAAPVAPAMAPPAAPPPTAPAFVAPSAELPPPAPTASPIADRRPESKPPVPIGFSVNGNVDQIWNTDTTYDLFSDRDVQLRPGLSVSYDLPELAPSLVLAPELGWGVEDMGDEGLLGLGLASTEYRAHSFYAAASLRYHLLRFLAPHVRLAAGLALADVSIQDATDLKTYEESSTSPFASLGAGVGLHTRPGQLGGAFQVGALVEGGYVLASPVDLSFDGGESARIRTLVASLGELSRSGPYLRLAVYLRF